MTNNTTTSVSKDPEKHTLTVKIENDDTGRSIPTFDIPKAEKVGDAANRAAPLLGFAAGGKYTLGFEGRPLDQNRPVHSYGVKDGDTLKFIDLGGGV